MMAQGRTTDPWLQRALRWLWLSLALLVICYAVLVSAVRLLLPAVDRYQARVDALLSQQLGTPVVTAGLSGEWRGLSPVLRATSVSIGESDSDAAPLALGRLRLEPDLARSLLRRQLVWKDLRLADIALYLVEDDAGRWRVDGLGEPGEADLSGMLDMLFHSDRIALGNTTLHLAFYSGTETRVEASDVQLENAGDFHRLTGAVRLAGMAESSRFIFEGRGRPDRLRDFSGRGHLTLNELHFSGDLSGLARQWLPDAIDRIGELHSNIHMETWLEVRPGGELRTRSLFRADQIPLNWVRDVPDARHVQAEVLGWLTPGEDWGISLQDLAFEWRGVSFEPFDVRFSQRLGARWTDFSLAMNRIELDGAGKLLLATGLLPERAASVLTELAPRGEAHNVHADFSLDGDQPRVRVRGNLQQAAVGSWRNAPAARGIDGYFEAGLREGMVALASEDLALWYPQIYDDFMPYGRVRGQVHWAWRPDESRVQVDAGPVTVSDEAGHGRVWLDLSLPINQPERGPEMTLQVALRDSHSRYRDRYLPTTLPATLRNWLDEAIGDAAIPRADFLWRGSFRDPEDRTVQLGLSVRDGALAFDPQWPVLEAIDAELFLNDADLDVTASSATLDGLAARDVSVRLRRADVGDPVIDVAGEVNGEVARVLDILLASPVGANLGFLDAWEAGGDVTGQLDLHLPLERLASDGRYRVTTEVTAGVLRSPVLKFDFDRIAGPLAFDSETGLYSDGLEGQLWGEPVAAVITADGRRTTVALDGELDLDDLARQWWPAQTVASGRTLFDARLQLEHTDLESSRLLVNSELEGVEVVLPEPLGKQADDTRSLSVDIELPRVGEHWELHWRYGEELLGRLQFHDDRFERGAVALRRPLPALPDAGGLLFAANAARVDWRDWWQRYENLELPHPGVLEAGVALPVAVDLQVEHLETGWLALENLSVQGGGSGGDWAFEVDSQQVAGEVRWQADAERPEARLVLDLDYLRLPAPSDIPGADEPTRIDPRTFPDLTLSVADLQVAERSWGALGMELTSDHQGARFDRLRGQYHGLTISQEDREQPAALHWLFDGEEHSTTLSGQFHVEEFGDLIRALGAEAPLESRRGAFNLSWSWPGKPWELRLETLSGLMNFELEEGVFQRSPGTAADAAIRVVGLFNFANWVRRLRLDFSDFFTEGVSFDRVTGGVMFRAGELVLDSPIDARLPSGQMRMTGRVDLMDETLDLRMVSTLPVGTNLPWMAAIVGGLPAAAGVYLTSKIFSSQVDRLSSISHHIHGDWDDPTVQVDRIFGDSGR